MALNLNKGIQFTEKKENELANVKKLNLTSYKHSMGKSLIYEDREILKIIQKRNKITIKQNDRDVTPKNLVELYIPNNFQVPADVEQFWSDNNEIAPPPTSSKTSVALDIDQSTTAISMVPDIEEILEQLQQGSLLECYTGEDTDDQDKIDDFKKMSSFIKIVLQETEVIVFYEQPSVTVLKGSKESQNVDANNAAYEYLTSEKGLNRRRSEAETQTNDILVKSRTTNTDKIHTVNEQSFVSNYDMYDTCKDVERMTNSKDVNIDTKIAALKTDHVDDFVTNLSTSKSFKLSSMILERLLAGNSFELRQKRFRNMYPPDPMDKDAQFLYRVDVLWPYKMQETMGKAVSSASLCASNSDIIAVGYGIYRFVACTQRRDGYVCVWNIKNPVNPERRYHYRVPVTAIAFSTKNPQFLAVGLYNGSIEVRDIITEGKDALIAKSHRSTSSGFEPVWDIKWIPGEDLFGINEQLLAISQDGRVMKYSFITGSYLLGYQQLMLNRVDGVVEGLQVVKKKDFIEANRHPKALFLRMHPIKTDDYFVGTDEGCIHRSSINFPAQHKMQAHRGGVYCMEYSPWSPKVFLTCGSDWYIRIWIEGLFIPICELSSGLGSVQTAAWSPINPTIFACVTRTQVEIWDIRRKTLKPASVHSFGAATEPLTIMKFTKNGRAIVVGDEEGVTYVCALDDMPFPPHYPYLDLQTTLYKCMDANPELLKQVKNFGYLGY